MNEKHPLPEEHIITDLDALKIIADPNRLDILRRMKTPRTVKEIAEILDKDPTKLYYHIRQLEKHSLIRVVETKIVSGIIEKTYQVVARQFRLEENLISGTEMTEENIDKLFGTIFDVTKNEMIQSIREGLMKPGDQTKPEKYGTARVGLFLTDEQTVEFYAKLESLWREYETLSKENKNNDDAQPKGLLIAFYPIHRPNLDD